MKRVLALAAAAMLAFSVSCSKNIEQGKETLTSNANQEQIDFDSLEIIRYSADRLICSDFEDFEKYSEDIIIGTALNDIETICVYEQSAKPTEIYSVVTIRVDRVIKGDLNVGDKISFAQHCGVSDGRFITYSEMAPTQKGQQWIFGIYKSNSEKYGNVYWSSGDYTSRFPIPDAKLINAIKNNNISEEEKIVSEMTSKFFGFYSDVASAETFYEYHYRDIVINYFAEQNQQ